MVLHCHLDHIGEVELFLGVVVLKFWKPFFKPLGGHGHDAAVDFFDFTLQRIGIFVFDDSVDLVVQPAHDTAISCRVFKVDGEQGQVFSIAGLNQSLQSIHLRKRHIARQNYHHTVVIQKWQGLLYRMACSKLRHLLGKLQCFVRISLLQKWLYHLCAVTGNQNCVARVQGVGGINHMLDQGLSGQWMQNFGHTALHACAPTRCHDHHI